MARKKKDGQRATGIQSKKGMLYIVTSKIVIKDGKRVSEKKWTATGLKDTPENVKIAAGFRSGLLNQTSQTTPNRDITLSEYVDQFLKSKKRTIADTTYSAYSQRGARIKEYFGDKKLNRIRVSDVENFLDYLITHKKTQQRTLKDIKALFSSVMEQAISEDLIIENPAKKATINKMLAIQNASQKDEGEDFFSFREAQLFLQIVEDHELYELFYFSLLFGLRREEVLGLRWSCIDFSKREFRINHTVTKGTTINRLNSTKTEASARVYPLSDEDIRIASELKKKEQENRRLFGNQYQENDYIFKHADGSLYYPDYPTKAFRKVIQKHPELPQDVTFHGLRYSCVSILVHKGYDVKSIQKYVGHKEIDTTLKIYAKVKEKEAKEEISKDLHNLFPPKNYDNNKPHKDQG